MSPERSTLGVKNKNIEVLGVEIRISKINEEDYICITDIAKYKGDKPDLIIQNWIRTSTTIQFLGLWEKLNNENFNPFIFEGIKKDSIENSFIMTPKRWKEKTNAIGIISKTGRYGGTYVHKDIAFKFSSWISVEFELYMIKEFQRLKEKEINNLDWTAKRFLTKINYKIHTDSIKENLIPQKLDKKEIGFIYANEADILNKALFGITAKDWREKNDDKKGNIRDYTTVEQLIVLANLESINSELIKMGLEQAKRLELLNNTAITQMKSLVKNNITKKLK